MTTTRPTLREWHGLNPPVICTVKQLARRRKDKISQVYRLRTVRPQDNVITESHPLRTWEIIEDGRLIGFMDTGTWHTHVEINPDEYVVLSVV
jgi:hypothetical protein